MSFRSALVLLAAFIGSGAAQAEFRDPLTTPALRTEKLTEVPMTAVVSAGGGRLVAAGWRGVIAVSEDAGGTWKQGSVPVREDMTGLAFTSPKHGWAVGNEGVLLETVDGGMSWIKRLDGNDTARLMVEKYSRLAEQNPADTNIAAALREAQGYQAQAPARPLLDIAFQNEQVGYIVGTFNMIFRTLDGGKTWEPLFEKTDNPNGYNIYCVRVVGDEVYLLGELGLALRLDRSKDRFVKMALPYDGTLFGLAATASTVVAGGLRGNAFVGDAAGKTWSKADFGTKTPATFGGAAVQADGTIVMVTLAGEMYASRDGGRQFRPVHVKAPMKYSAVASIDLQRVVVVGLRGIRIESIQ